LRKLTERVSNLENHSQKAATLFPTTQPFQVLNGNIISSAENGQDFLDKGFNKNDSIFSATQLVSEKIKMASWSPYTVKDEKALKSMRVILNKGEFSVKDIANLSYLKTKALELYDSDAKLTHLLKYPNDNDTFPDIVANSSVNKLLLGNRFIWADILESGANQGKPNSIELLPSQYVTLVVSRTWPFKILAYKIMAWGDLTFSKEKVFIDRYYNPNADINGTHLYGFAPMRPGEGIVDRSNSENMAAAMAFHNGGPRTIIWVDEPAWSDATARLGQANAVKAILTSKEYSGAANSNKLAASAWKMGATPVGLSPVDLGIPESEVNTLRRICNLIGGIPSQLMNDPDNKTFNSLVEAEKALTTRAALPLMNSFRDQFNRKLGTDWGYKDKGIYIDYDISVYSELQEDLGKKWTGYVERLPVSNGYKMDLMGLDHEEGQEEWMKQILVPSGFELSDSYGENETDRALEEGDE
jgi:phage portal protein BeeE